MPLCCGCWKVGVRKEKPEEEMMKGAMGRVGGVKGVKGVKGVVHHTLTLV